MHMHISGTNNPATLPLILAAPPFTALRDAAAAGRHAIVGGDCARGTVPPGFDRPSLSSQAKPAVPTATNTPTPVDLSSYASWKQESAERAPGAGAARTAHRVARRVPPP